MKTTLLLIIAATCFATTVARAQTSSRNSVDLGVTNNANLTKDNPTSDTYLRLTSSNTFKPGADKLGLRLSYVDYFSQNPNDLFTLRLSDRHETDDWNFTGAVFSNIYTSGSPGTADSAFTNVGFEVTADRDRSWGRASVAYGGGYRLRYFPSFDGRNDHTVFAMATLDKEVTSKLTLGANSEYGILLSSLPEYSRMYLDLGGTAEYLLPSDWSLSGDLSLSNSYFLNRTVTTQTQVNRNRGSGLAGTRTSAETYSSIFMSVEGMRQQTETFRWGFGLYMTNQSSASGSFDYSVTDVLAKLSLNF